MFNIGLGLVFLGSLLGAVYAGLAVWGDWEALSFRTGEAFMSDETFRGLRCPVLMSARQAEEIHVTLRNPTDSELSRTVRVFISEGDTFNLRTFIEKVRLAPGESRVLSWEIYPQDAVYDLFVLVRVFVFRTATLPSQDAACGVMVLDLPVGSGDLIIAFLVGSGLLSMGAGAWLMRRARLAASDRALSLASNAKALAVFALAGMVAGHFGSLLLGSGALLLFFLLGIITAAQAFSGS
jgi:hypothetical protein